MDDKGDKDWHKTAKKDKYFNFNSCIGWTPGEYHSQANRGDPLQLLNQAIFKCIYTCGINH